MNDDSVHKYGNLDVHSVTSYINFVREKAELINNVSPTFCSAKWLQSTILLYNGMTHSCHHPSRHKITLKDIENNPKGIHNTAVKIQARKEMLAGVQTKECDYCWRIENSNKENISDRIYKSTYPWALPHLDAVVESGLGENIDPAYVEVAFDTTCNFKCIYCSPVSSSKWQEEIERFGSIPQVENNLHDLNWLSQSKQLPIPNREPNPYIDAFWKWWPELYPKLNTFRITGGEPLLSKHTWRVLDYVKSNPSKDLTLAINTNLNVPNNLVDKLIDRVNDINENVGLFDVYTSLESTGEQAEYARFGMNYEEFVNNCHKVLANTPQSTRIHFMTTINVLSAPTFLNFLELVKELRLKYKREKHSYRVRTHLSYLRWPQCLQLTLLSKEDKQKYADEWLTFIHANKLTSKKEEHETFYLEEVDQLERTVKWMLNSDKEPKSFYDNFRLYVKACDNRRLTSFTETFPEISYLMDENYYG